MESLRKLIILVSFLVRYIDLSLFTWLYCPLTKVHDIYMAILCLNSFGFS
jgi:hypothetical protein